MALHVHDFMDCFLVHVLRKRFVGIRHYGFLANRDRGSNIELCRHLRGVDKENTEQPAEPDSPTEASDKALLRCPDCGEPMLVIREFLASTKRPHFALARMKPSAFFYDTS